MWDHLTSSQNRDDDQELSDDEDDYFASCLFLFNAPSTQGEGHLILFPVPAPKTRPFTSFTFLLFCGVARLT